VDQPHGRCEPATQSGSMVDHEQCRQRVWRCLINAQRVSARARRSLPVVVEGGEGDEAVPEGHSSEDERWHDDGEERLNKRELESEEKRCGVLRGV
jgi:hypothetical protein